MASAWLQPLQRHPSQSLVRLTQPCLLVALPRSHKELQPHNLLHLSRPPRQPGWLPAVAQDGNQLLREMALCWCCCCSKRAATIPIPICKKRSPSSTPGLTETRWLLFPWSHHATSSLDFLRKSPGMRQELTSLLLYAGSVWKQSVHLGPCSTSAVAFIINWF